MTTVEILEVTQVIEVNDTHIDVVTVGTQGPPAGIAGLTGSYNISVGGTYGGVFNITLLNGLVRSIGIYGM